jgi:peptide/nickel transport system ATP-binding protein
MLTQATPPALRIEDLSIGFDTDEGVAEVLDKVDLTVGNGHVVGVVGESGCGKSTLVRAILGILPKAAQVRSGRIWLGSTDILALDEHQLTKEIRGKKLGFIPQDPFLALNPVFKVGTQILEIMRHNAARASEMSLSQHRRRLTELFDLVQIPDPAAALGRYPHEFSGGQRQRILIAAALSCDARMIIADEPTTALDVTTQLDILRLIHRLRRDFDLSVLLVTHDFGVVAQLCDQVCVMYAGQVAEAGPTRAVLAEPKHPYTRLLIECHPDKANALKGIPGSVPQLVRPPTGCRFHPRCPDVRESCPKQSPAAHCIGDQIVHCVLYD